MALNLLYEIDARGDAGDSEVTVSITLGAYYPAGDGCETKSSFCGAEGHAPMGPSSRRRLSTPGWVKG